MSSPPQDDPRKRDRALARALLDALRPARPSANNPSGPEDCPDAEVIAAYADRGLAEDEIARWEQHFSACARCQKVLAVLNVTAEPLAQADVERLGELAAGAAVPLPAAAAAAVSGAISRPEAAARSRAADSKSSRPWRAWHFVAPAAGVAAALALWFALHPTPPVQNNSAQLNQAKTAAPPAAAPPDTQQMAEANVPPPPSSAAVAKSVPRETESSAPSSGVSLAKNKATRGDELSPAAAEPSPPTQSVRELPLNGRDSASLQTLQSGSAGGSAESGRQASAAPDVESTEQSVQVATEAPQVELQSGTVPAPRASPAPAASARPAPPPAPAPAAALGGAFGASNMRALNKATGGAAPAAQAWLDTFELLDGSVSWRVGTGGRIKRSTDQGQTWQAQTSGVSTDLSEGDAVSAQVAWVVGRAGVILRTTDGEHWQRTALPASLPAGAPPDWMLVQAQDSLRATVVSTDGNTFSTRDGGATWTANRSPAQ